MRLKRLWRTARVLFASTGKTLPSPDVTTSDGAAPDGADDPAQAANASAARAESRTAARRRPASRPDGIAARALISISRSLLVAGMALKAPGEQGDGQRAKHGEIDRKAEVGGGVGVDGGAEQVHGVREGVGRGQDLEPGGQVVQGEEASGEEEEREEHEVHHQGEPLHGAEAGGNDLSEAVEEERQQDHGGACQKNARRHAVLPLQVDAGHGGGDGEDGQGLEAADGDARQRLPQQDDPRRVGRGEHYPQQAGVAVTVVGGGRESGGEEDGHCYGAGDEERSVVAVAHEGGVKPLGNAGAEDREDHEGEEDRRVELGAGSQDAAQVALEDRLAGGDGAHSAPSSSDREAPTMSK